MIDIMPTEKKQDFVAKGNLLLKLANAETEMEDKIILYGRAASYFRKYDTELYENTIKLLLQKYFETLYLILCFSTKDNCVPQGFLTNICRHYLLSH